MPDNVTLPVPSGLRKKAIGGMTTTAQQMALMSTTKTLLRTPPPSTLLHAWIYLGFPGTSNSLASDSWPCVKDYPDPDMVETLANVKHLLGAVGSFGIPADHSEARAHAGSRIRTYSLVAVATLY